MYTPYGDTIVKDSFTYIANDGFSNSKIATVKIDPHNLWY
jgi:hypothetical protein